MRENSLSFAEIRDALTINTSVAGKAISGWIGFETKPKEEAEDLTESQGVVVKEDGEKVGVSRVNNKICKVSAICTHLGGVLTWNDAENSWDCPLHGSRFTADGKVLEGPASDSLKVYEAGKAVDDS